MNRSHLFSLSNYLSQHMTFDADEDTTGCDHTFKHTLAWIAEHNLDREAWLDWLQRRGAWCDCGVVQEVLLFEPSELGEHTPTIPITELRGWRREM